MCVCVCVCVLGRRGLSGQVCWKQTEAAFSFPASCRCSVCPVHVLCDLCMFCVYVTCSLTSPDQFDNAYSSGTFLSSLRLSLAPCVGPPVQQIIPPVCQCQEHRHVRRTCLSQLSWGPWRGPSSVNPSCPLPSLWFLTSRAPLPHRPRSAGSGGQSAD